MFWRDDAARPRIAGQDDDGAPRMIEIHGQSDGDRLDIAERDAPDWNGRIALSGDGAVSIGSGTRAAWMNVVMGPGAALRIGSGCRLGHLDIYVSGGATLEIGDGCAFNGSVNLYLHEPSHMRIGAHCLFGGDVLVTTSDMHSIIEVESGRRLNFAKDVTIGDRVWIGAHATVLKGVSIGDGSVVGGFSVLTRAVRRNALVAGNPARLIREGVTWSPDLLPR
jgi:acetyltransferase-like isoleucine patch superfamily enzyme